MFTSFREITDIWPTHGELARETGALYEQVRKWRSRGKIPGEWWLPVVRAAHRRGIAVSLEDLAVLGLPLRAVAADRPRARKHKAA